MNTRLLSRRPLLRSAALCALAVCALLGACTARSLWLNRALRRSVDAVVEAGEAPGHTVGLADIERLRSRIDSLRALDAKGPPWSMRFGMYRGREVLARATATWGRWVRRSLVEPHLSASDRNLKELLLKDRRDALTENVRRVVYEGLELHLALTSPKEAFEPTLAQRTLSEFALGALVRASCADARCDDPSQVVLRRNLRRYLDLLSDGAAAPIDRRHRLVQLARESLNHRPAPYLEVDQIVAHFDVDASAIDPHAVLPGLPASFRHVSRTIPGALTRRGWERFVRDRLSLRGDPHTERWVLGFSGSGSAVDMSQLVRMRSDYFLRYCDGWREFFFDGTFHVPDNLADSLAVLQWMTATEDTPFAAWIRVAADNLRLEEHVDPQSLANATVAERALMGADWERNSRIYARREFTHRECVRRVAREELSAFFVAPREDDAANPSSAVSANVSTLRQCGAQHKALLDTLRAVEDGARVPTEAEIQRMNLVLERQEAIVRSVNFHSRFLLRLVCVDPALAAIANACAWSQERRGASAAQARQRCPPHGMWRWPR